MHQLQKTEANIWMDEFTHCTVVEIEGRYYRLEIGEDITDEIGMYVQNPELVATLDPAELE